MRLLRGVYTEHIRFPQCRLRECARNDEPAVGALKPHEVLPQKPPHVIASDQWERGNLTVLRTLSRPACRLTQEQIASLCSQ